MTAKTGTERANSYAERQRKAGLQKVAVWVPADAVETLKRYAEELRKQSKR